LIDIRDENDYLITYSITPNLNWQNINISFLSQYTTTSTTQIIPRNIKYGRLYNYYASIDTIGIIPEGWHIPSDSEWQTLIDFCCGTDFAALKLKTTGTTFWNEPIETETNEYNFSAIGSGSHSDKYGYSDMNLIFYALSSTNNGTDSNVVYISYEIIGFNVFTKYFGQAIRLIKNNSINTGDIIIDWDLYNQITIGTQVWLKQNLATRHYNNGDPILSDFSGTIGAVTAYNNDESFVYY